MISTVSDDVLDMNEMIYRESQKKVYNSSRKKRS